MHSLTTDYAKNYCNQTLIVQVTVDMFFSQTQCTSSSLSQYNFSVFNWCNRDQLAAFTVCTDIVWLVCALVAWCCHWFKSTGLWINCRKCTFEWSVRSPWSSAGHLGWKYAFWNVHVLLLSVVTAIDSDSSLHDVLITSPVYQFASERKNIYNYVLLKAVFCSFHIDLWMFEERHQYVSLASRETRHIHRVRKKTATLNMSK